jgi:MFS family permease
VSTSAGVRTTPLLGRRYRAATVGGVSLVFIAAFEALAVATIMPTVAHDLDGERWFALAFAATVATSVVGMVLAGQWADRRGAAGPLLTSVTLFGIGLAVAGAAPDMGLLVVGRVAQGLGAGGLTVALYVLVAQAYDEVDRPRILGAYAAAWVVPGIVGPLLAGTVTDLVGWRWVFLGLVGVSAAAALLLVPTLVSLGNAPVDDAPVPPGSHGRRLLHAVVLATAVLAASLVAGGGVGGAVLGLGAAGVALAAVRGLLPAGTLRAAPGLPAVVSVRGLASGTFVAAEAFLPYLLQVQYDVAVWLSGLVLTGATLGWAAASYVQGRLGTSVPDARLLRVGSVNLVVGMLVVLTVAALHLPSPLVGLGWVITASGMGLIYPRVTSYALARAGASDRGTASAAVALSDSTGAAIALAVAGFTFTALGGSDMLGAFVAVLTFTAGLAVVTAVAARRAEPSGS